MAHLQARYRWLPWLAVVLIALIAALPLGDATPYGDDIRLHLYRIPVVNALWQAGVPFARWLPSLNLGHGSPLFNFYPPLSAYLLTAVYWLAGQNGPAALNLLFGLALFMSAAGMFIFARSLFGPAGGLLSAILYTWAPHLVYQTYARGSLSNALALALFPFAAWALVRTGQRPSPRTTLLAAAFLALILLSHTAASLLFLGPLIVLGVTAVFLPGKAGRAARLRAVLLALLLGLGLGTFSWLPALAEIQYTRYAQEAGNVDFAAHFADVWRWPETTTATAHNPGLPKSTGYAQLSLGAAGTAVAGLALVRWRQRRQTRRPAADALTAVAGLMGLAALFLAVSASAPVWAAVAPLRALQFPWRLLDIPLFLLALAGGRLWAGKPARRPRPAGPALLLGAAAICLSFANMIPYLYPPAIHLPARPTLADVTAVQQQYGIYGLTAWGEYSSSAVTTWPAAPPFANAGDMLPLAAKVLEPPSGFTAVAGDPWRAAWHTRLDAPQTITLAVHTFPGWQARIDGRPVPLTAAAAGRIQIPVPAGEHEVTLAFTRTPVRWLADALSLLALIAGAGLAICGWRRPRRQLPAAADEQPSPRFIGGLLLLLALLLLLKVAWLDQASNPLVVHPANGRIPGTAQPEHGRFQDQVQLLGYQIEPPNQLILFWQALQAGLPRYQVAVTLADARGVPRQEIRQDAPGYTVTTNWEAGQLVRDVYTLSLDQPPPAGYQLWVSLLDRAGEPLALTGADGQTAVAAGRLKSPPGRDTAVPETMGVTFGPGSRLRHAYFPTHLATGDPLNLTLVWESLAPVAADYTVFVHLLDADGEWAAGQDGQPLGGLYPTSYWEPGEVIVDAREWQPDLPPGVYQLQVGLYQLQTGERLPAAGAGVVDGDRAILGTIEITD